MSVQNWAGNVTFAARQLHRPTTVDELQHLIADLPHARALGTGHSFNRIADTSGDLISTADLDVPIVIDPAARTVEVGGGVRFAELAVQLDAAGWALPNLGSLPHISLAGACATGTHGSGVANRCLAAGVAGVDFVRADGELVRVARGDADFGGSVLALGALGVVTRMTLDIVPTYDLRQEVWVDAPTDAVLENLDEVMGSGYSVSLFTTWSRPDVIDMIWVKAPADADRVDFGVWGATAATEPMHPIAGEDTSAATEQLGVPGPWHARLPHFRAEFRPSAGDEQQSEYLIAREHGAAAIAALREVEYGSALQVSEIRTVAADDLWLSPCHDRDTLALHCTWVADDARVQPAVAAVEAALAPFDARPHWGKVFAMPAAEVRARYPRLGEFAELAARHDPQRRFGNAYLENIVY
jgi:xylitol oxidase